MFAMAANPLVKCFTLSNVLNSPVSSQDLASLLCSTGEITQPRPGALTGSIQRYRRAPSTLSRLRKIPPQSYILAAVKPITVLRESLSMSGTVSVLIGTLLPC